MLWEKRQDKTLRGRQCVRIRIPRSQGYPTRFSWGLVTYRNPLTRRMFVLCPRNIKVFTLVFVSRCSPRVLPFRKRPVYVRDCCQIYKFIKPKVSTTPGFDGDAEGEEN
jgi:hypothetical protein